MAGIRGFRTQLRIAACCSAVVWGSTALYADEALPSPVAGTPSIPIFSGGGATDPISAYFLHWQDRVKEAQDSQPHWMTPLVTVTPRLEQEIRYDQTSQQLGNGAHIESFDNGKGLELIPTTTNEILFNAPPYFLRSSGTGQITGLGDWPVVTVKQRIVSANEENGNYILTAFFGVQAPIGDA